MCEGGCLKKSKRLEPVKKIAEGREAAAAGQLAESVQKQRDNKEQLEKLKSYRDDYVAAFKQQGTGGISAMRLQDYQAFVRKLNLAIDAQAKVVEEGNIKINEHQQVLKEKNGQKKAMEKLIGGIKKKEAVIDEKKEQNEADDRGKGGGSGADTLMWRFS